MGRILTDSAKEMRAKALELRLKGLTYGEIGEMMGVSRQYVQQMTCPPREIYHFVRKRAGSKCQKCDVDITSGHVHHKTLNDVENYNDIDNLEYLCASCHRHEHVPQPEWRPDMDRRGDSVCSHCQYKWLSRVINPKNCPRCKYKMPESNQPVGASK